MRRAVGARQSGSAAGECSSLGFQFRSISESLEMPPDRRYVKSTAFEVNRWIIFDNAVSN
jgi:hypothetical protein